MNRKDAFAALLAQYQQAPTDYDEDTEEDPRPYFSGEKELAPWVCVTVNYSSHGYAKYFFLPTFATSKEAAERAVEYVQDDLFEELPVAVVNLDDGTTFEPEWSLVPWAKVVKAAALGDDAPDYIDHALEG